ncbi:hypothetical protein [Synechococcus elongatus]|uniref:hypothetical protein n=1 Tax=Synechococcus elongatus TaxID=32046 RepID=UPI000F7D6223|nr:hypothetical protein [Synechococcus elongatus]
MTAIAPDWEALLQSDAAALAEQLLASERQARSQRPAITSADLEGLWQLQAGLNKTGRLWRWPAFLPATLEYRWIEAESGQITNQICLGAMRFRFRGPCQFEVGRNLLWFDFEQWQLAWGDRLLVQGRLGGAAAASRLSDRLQQRPRPKLPFFHYFSVTPTVIAARGRGGGVALWQKVKASQACRTDSSPL